MYLKLETVFPVLIYCHVDEINSTTSLSAYMILGTVLYARLLIPDVYSSLHAAELYSTVD